ncbi:class GN sortase [Marinobacter halodurans]|uniref:Class GN sortase n=1 Tax=Marinobacter halodurans TaxID=2528979 RepID=A0ABY1ZJS3_9GAMM|nr:class GN sortase [Marinobacter halodurans]TBW55462.1 class GN sortase [Marinobacter halodurans]
MMRLLMTLTVAAAITLVAGLWIPLKAQLAQQLLNMAWAQSQAEQARTRPWPWADTWPVGRLRLPEDNEPLVVLAGTSGESLAFGPGHVTASALPGQPGTVILAGHRDTHFSVLQEIRVGDRLALQGLDGDWRRYRVVNERVVDSRQSRLDFRPDGTNRLILVTCYPFDALDPHGPLRYVIEAEDLAGLETDGHVAVRPIRKPAKIPSGSDLLTSASVGF